MPTTYAHHRYGRSVFSLLPPEIQGDLEPYMDYYDIGVHGPDILFYYRSFRHNPFNQYGVRVHHEKAAVFFTRAMEVFKSQRGQPEARAYLAGFMTHFILDSTCHPYINKRARETGVSHTEIETDLDTVLMREDGLVPSRVKRAGWIHPSYQKAKIIAPYYGQSPAKILEGLIWQKAIVDHIFRSRFGVKRWTAGIIRRSAGPNSRKGSVIRVLDEHFSKSRVNPASRETLSALQGLMRACQGECADMIVGLWHALESGDREYTEHKRLQRNFS